MEHYFIKAPLIFLFLFLQESTGFCFGDPVLSEVIRTVRENEQKRSSGLKGGTYLMDFTVSTLKSVGNEWVVERDDSGEGNASAPAISNRQELNNLLLPFNEDFEGNLKKIQIYAVYIRFPDLAIRSGIPQAVKSSDKILDFLKNRSEAEFATYNDYLNDLSRQVEEQLKSDVFTQPERVIVLVGEYRFRNRDQWKRRITRACRTRGVFIHQVEANLSEFVESRLDTRTDYPEGMNAGARYIHDFIHSSLEFFADPDNLSGDESCAELNASLTRQIARDYVDLWCEAIQGTPEVKKYVFAIAQYLDRLGPWIEDMDVSNLDNLTNLTVQNYLDLYQDNIDQFLGWKAFLASRIDESASIAELGLWIRWASDDDYRNLSLTRKEKLMALYSNYWGQGFPLYIAGLNVVQILSPEWMPVTYLYMPQRVMTGVLEGNTPEEIRQFLDFLASSPGMVNRLYEVADNLFTANEREEGLVNLISRLSLKAEGYEPGEASVTRFVSDFGDKTFIWKVPPWYQELTNGYNTYEKEIGYNGRVGIVERNCIRTFCYPDGWMHEPREVEHCQCAEFETHDFDFSPFELVALTFAEKASFLGLCAADPVSGCHNRTLLFPAFALAWIIEKKSDDDLFNSGMATLDAVGFAVGVGELNAAIHTGSLARKLLAGWTLLSESAGLLVTNEGFRDYLTETYGDQGLVYYNNLQVINLINSAGTNIAGMLDLGDAVRFLGTESALRRAGEEIPDQIGIAAADVERALEPAREQTSAYFGFSEGMRMRTREMALREETELYWQLEANLPMKAVFNGKPQLTDVWYAIEADDAYRFYLELDHAGQTKFWNDLASNSDLAAGIRQNPILFGAWQLLEDGPYRTDLHTLELFNDYVVLSARNKILGYGIDEIYPDIPIEELTAIRHYTLMGYEPLNEALRSGNPSALDLALETLINNGLSKLSGHSGMSFRGTSVDIQTVLNKYKAAFENGTPITEDAFTSTSKSIIIAQKFQGVDSEDLSAVLDPALPDKQVKVFFHIEGAKGKEIENISHYGPNGSGQDEFEVLFKSKSEFQVTNFKTDAVDAEGNVVVEIFLTEL